MARQPDGPKGDINWEEVWQKIAGGKSSDDVPKFLKQGRMIWIVIGIAILIWLLTGIYTVGPGEEGVVKTFGKHTSTTSPGLNYHWPAPIQSVKRVNVEKIRTAEIGFRSDGPSDVPKESQMLTGDENIVKAQVVVQYRVRDSAKYLFNVRDLEQAVHAATEVALRSVVGSNTIDFVLLEGRTIVQEEVDTFLQRLLDDYDSGLLVTAVKLQETFPPDEVKDAFDEVVRAREDKQKLIREAEGYAADRVPKARGEAEQLILGSQAYKEQRVLEAEGDIAKFLKVIREHEVPAAFQALADSGVSQASEVLSQLGAIENEIDLLVITGTESEVATELESILDLETDAGLEEESGSTPSLSRETLTEILKLLGAVDSSRTPEEVTSQVLIEALAQLGLADEYEQFYLEAIRLTRERLYLETMEDVLLDTEKFIVDPESSGNLVPFLPLKELTGSEQTQEAGE